MKQGISMTTEKGITMNILKTSNTDNGLVGICQLRDRLSDEEVSVLHAISLLPRAFSAEEWHKDVEGLNQEPLSVHRFIEIRESLLAAKLVTELSAQPGHYKATHLGRCVVINRIVNMNIPAWSRPELTDAELEGAHGATSQPGVGEQLEDRQDV